MKIGLQNLLHIIFVFVYYRVPPKTASPSPIKPKRGRPKFEKVQVEYVKKNCGMGSKNKKKADSEEYFHKVEEEKTLSLSEESEDTEDSEESLGIKSLPSSLESLSGSPSPSPTKTKKSGSRSASQARKTKKKSGSRSSSPARKTNKKSGSRSPSPASKTNKKTDKEKGSPKKATPRKYSDSSPTGKQAKNDWSVDAAVEVQIVPWLEDHPILWDSTDPERHKNDKTDVVWKELATLFPQYSGKYAEKNVKLVKELCRKK